MHTYSNSVLPVRPGLRADRAGVVLFAIVLLLSATFAHAQNVRWDLGGPGSAGVVTSGAGSVLVALGNVQLAWCVYPANAVPCTNYANTYPSITSTTACPTTTQVVLQGSSTCVATSDAQGNLGVYAPAGTYAYTLTANGVSYGPFLVTVGAGGGVVPLTALTGDIPRFNVNGDNAWDAVPYSQWGTGVMASVAAAGATIGIGGGGTSTGCCTESVSAVNPTLAVPYPMSTYSFGTASTNGVIGLQQGENGNTGQFFIRGFNRMHFQHSIVLNTNTRYYFGLAVWANTSTLGTNGTNVLGTTVFSTDTPNHTFVGFRASQGTDTTFQCLVIQAGVTATTVIVNSGVAIDGNVHAFDVTLDSANVNFSFYIDGKFVGTALASTISATPVFAGDAMATMMFTGDNKNTTNTVSLTFARMTLDLK